MPSRRGSMARGGGRREEAASTAAASAARGRRRRSPRGRGPLGLVCLALLCGLGAAEAEFAILEEAQVVAAQMRKLAAEELGVVTMQVRPGRPRFSCPAALPRASPPIPALPLFSLSLPSSPAPFPSLRTFPPFVRPRAAGGCFAAVPAAFPRPQKEGAEPLGSLPAAPHAGPRAAPAMGGANSV